MFGGIPWIDAISLPVVPPRLRLSTSVRRSARILIRTTPLYRKFEFDPAPLVLGLVISPILEQSLRQSLIMSNGNYLIFFSRPISGGLMIVSICLLALSASSFLLKRADWRAKRAEAEAGEIET